MSDEPNGVYISLRDIYDELVKVKESVQSLANNVDSSKDIQKDQEERIRGLERWRYGLTVSAALGIISLILTVIQTLGGLK